MNFRNYKLIQYHDRWMIRRGWIFHSYFDTDGFWWGKTNALRYATKYDSKEDAQQVLNFLIGK